MVVQILAILHILSTIAAVGASATYFFWLGRAVNSPESRVFALETIRMMERRYVIPAYIVVGITGLGLVDRGSKGWSTPWIELSMLLYVVLMGLVGFHSRDVKRQISLAADGGPDSTGYRDAQTRGRILRLLQIVAVVCLVYLMVFKPTLWG